MWRSLKSFNITQYVRTLQAPKKGHGRVVEGKPRCLASAADFWCWQVRNHSQEGPRRATEPRCPCRPLRMERYLGDVLASPAPGLFLEFLFWGWQGRGCPQSSPSHVAPWAALWGFPRGNSISHPTPSVYREPTNHERLSGTKHGAHSTRYLFFSCTWSSNYWAITSYSRSQCLFYFSNLKISKESIFSGLLHKTNFLNPSSSKKWSRWMSPILSVYTPHKQHICEWGLCPPLNNAISMDVCQAI